MKKISAILAIVLCMAATDASAGCYTARELEAEQGLRIHSELMVIGLTCLKMPGGQQLYEKYARFTQNNQDLISGYEDAIISYYAADGRGGNAERRLHSLRTDLANSISQHTIRMGTLSFCQNFSSRIDKALSMDRTKLRKWAQHVWPGTPLSQPVCAGVLR